MKYIIPEHQDLIPQYRKDVAESTSRFTALAAAILAFLSMPVIFSVLPEAHPQKALILISSVVSTILFIFLILPFALRFPVYGIQPWYGVIMFLQAISTIPLAYTLPEFSNVFTLYGLLAGLTLVTFWSEYWSIFVQVSVWGCMLITPYVIGRPYTVEIILYIVALTLFCITMVVVHRWIWGYRWQQFYNQYQVQQLNKALKLQTAELDAFAHTVAHDLKNPLTGIIGYTDLLQDMLSDDGKLDEQTAVILDQLISIGRHGFHIIDGLLLFAATRRTEVEREPLQMDLIVQKALLRVRHQIEKKNAVVKIADDWPTAVGYAPWVEELWSNYISNALKYGGFPPHIEMGADFHDDKIRFWVRDNGAGLSLEQQSHLFVEFGQLGQKGESGGHGLGLSIVRRIAEKLDGDVGVESTIGKGSTFFFTLPRS